MLEGSRCLLHGLRAQLTAVAELSDRQLRGDVDLRTKPEVIRAI